MKKALNDIVFPVSFLYPNAFNTIGRKSSKPDIEKLKKENRFFEYPKQKKAVDTTRNNKSTQKDIPKNTDKETQPTINIDLKPVAEKLEKLTGILYEILEKK
jgi:hypothetical protein